MTNSSKWLFVCLCPLAACGGSSDDASQTANAASADTGALAGVICSSANENTSISLACPPGQTIASVNFASYGTPSGSCGAFSLGACDASNTKSIVANACIGKQSCSVAASNGTFGDPCQFTVKALDVQVTCGAQASGTVCVGAGSGGTSTSGGAGAATGSAGTTTMVGTGGTTNAGGSAGSATTAGSAGSATTAGSGGASGASTTAGTGGAATTAGTGGATTTAGTGGTTAGGAGGSGPVIPPGTARPSWNTGTGFYVVGSKIYDANGVEFHMRGVNHTHWWGGTNEEAIPYIAKANANTTRAVFGPDGGATTPAQHESIVRQYIAQGVVPVVDYHNATCKEDPASLSAAVDMWLGPDKAWLQSLERYVILNVTNEWGPNSTVWRDSYITAVGRLRAAGVKNLVMIDAGGACGQLAESVESWGKDIFDSDPEKNVVFSIHQYGFWVDPGSPLAGKWDGRQPYDIDAELTRLQATGLPLVIGEFSWDTFNQVTYTTRAAVTAYEKHGVGWLAWMWNNPGGDPSVNMATTNVYNSSADLTDFGKMLVEDPVLGMKTTAHKATIF